MRCVICGAGGHGLEEHKPQMPGDVELFHVCRTCCYIAHQASNRIVIMADIADEIAATLARHNEAGDDTIKDVVTTLVQLSKVARAFKEIPEPKAPEGPKIIIG